MCVRWGGGNSCLTVADVELVGVVGESGEERGQVLSMPHDVVAFAVGEAEAGGPSAGRVVLLCTLQGLHVVDLVHEAYNKDEDKDDDEGAQQEVMTR